MNIRSVAAAVLIMSVLLGFFVWLYSAGTIGLVAIVITVLSGSVFLAVSRFFYKQLWPDDEI